MSKEHDVFLQETDIVRIISTLPFTTVSKLSSCTAGMKKLQLKVPSTLYPDTSTCQTIITSYIPILTEKDMYLRKGIIPIPYFKKGYVNNDWKEVVIPETHLIYRTGKVLSGNFDEFTCLEDREDLTCTICARRKTEPSILSDCLKGLLQNDTSECTMKNMETVQDQFQKINDEQYLYIDVQPGKMVEACPNMSEVETKLQTSGILTLDPNCTYKFANGPIGQETSEIDPHVIVSVDDLIKKVDIETEDDPIILEHIRENITIYFSTTITIMGVLTFIILYVCCKPRYIARQRERHSSNRRVRRMQGDNEVNLALIGAVNSIGNSFPPLPIRSI
jgi:hypothetical protein